jgi:hypothetical protein
LCFKKVRPRNPQSNRINEQSRPMNHFAINSPGGFL